ncbi:MAG: NYN domain-containing protein [Candidatus Heimdallarchaeota archaeon]|nr:NYN domain-containing protein [Candidatus Heimdallarchaeota archaeon]MCK4954852.1 NYN domain-containing protein [Candidatus Heimdallarchaeota archaeon]
MSETEEVETAEEKRLYERITDRILSSSYIKILRERLSGERKTAIIVDGPNFLRKVRDRQIKLEEIDEVAKDTGLAIVKKVILNEFASEKLIQAITNSGYEPIVTSYDIHITMSIEIMKILQKNKSVGLIVIASRDARIVPILLKLKEKGIETAIVGFEPGLSVAVKKMADQTFLLN